MLTTHVVSQGLAEELREAGWPQEGSTFYWVKVYPYSLVLPGPSWELMYHGQLVDYKEGEYLFYAAPLASELMERIPGGYFAYRRGNSWFTGKDLHQIAVAVASDSMPNALATLWLHLKKEGLLK